MTEQPQVRVTVELPASEDPASWDRKGAEELAKALQQTGQFEVATKAALREALRRFQRDHGLAVTGEIDKATMAALRATEESAYGETATDPSPPSSAPYVVSTSTSLKDGKATIKISLWTSKSHVLVNGTTVTGKPEDLDEDIFHTMCGPSREEKAICAAAIEAAKWIRQRLPLLRVRVIASSANIMEAPSLQSARITTVPRGTILRKVEEQKQWLKVIVDSSDSGETGWIYSELVGLVK